jgi:hypothetical protein
MHLVRFWPIATDRILVADRRFRGITGHGRSGGRPDPDANDPKQTLPAIRPLPKGTLTALPVC